MSTPTQKVASQLNRVTSGEGLTAKLRIVSHKYYYIAT